MKLELLSIAMALTGALAVMSHGSRGFGGSWGGGMVVSRRNAETAAANGAETPTVAELSALVQALLGGAREGMSLDAMGAAAVSIQLAADQIVDAQGGEGMTES
ncbi:hypothetical protein RRG08_001468 [Elysia crispata]|uniref:Uncharacterized protein n=1 Tax=Elysia crispata TaxID=231223 RepID=A0AAE0YEB9_9GAST|nr:hypothetical protein RRG08_001468 [Elysia crispata]